MITSSFPRFSPISNGWSESLKKLHSQTLTSCSRSRHRPLYIIDNELIFLFISHVCCMYSSHVICFLVTNYYYYYYFCLLVIDSTEISVWKISIDRNAHCMCWTRMWVHALVFFSTCFISSSIFSSLFDWTLSLSLLLFSHIHCCVWWFETFLILRK